VVHNEAITYLLPIKKKTLAWPSRYKTLFQWQVVPTAEEKYGLRQSIKHGTATNICRLYADSSPGGNNARIQSKASTSLIILPLFMGHVNIFTLLGSNSPIVCTWKFLNLNLRQRLSIHIFFIHHLQQIPTFLSSMHVQQTGSFSHQMSMCNGYESYATFRKYSFKYQPR
jgi:hypothetical protein